MKKFSLKKVLISYMPGFSQELEEIKSVILKNKIQVTAVNRNRIKKQILGYDLVITLGGDGTFLRTSHFVYDKTPVLGLNPSPQTKEGFFTCSILKSFTNDFDKLVLGEFKIIPLIRLQAKINGKNIKDLAMNEFYFGRKTGFHMSKYELKFGKKTEIQKSSGVLVGTPQGTHSWIGSAGGIFMPIDSKKFQYIVREPYHGKLIRPKLVNGLMQKTQFIELKPLTDGFILVVDSLKAIEIDKYSKVIISVSDRFLNFVTF